MLPHEIFSLRNGFFVVKDHIFGNEISSYANCFVRERSEQLRPAKVGAGNDSQLANHVRGDYILWLSEEFERQEPENPLFMSLKRLRLMLEESLGFTATRTSVQLAKYEGNGSRYVRHSDVGLHHLEAEGIHKYTESRTFTIVYYLNPLWKLENGGQLRVFAADNGNSFFDFEPVADRMVIFPSCIEHEVLPTHGRSRWALTMWLYSHARANVGTLETGINLPVPRSPEEHSIFVSIACYRDTDIVNTVNDLFEKAKDSSRISVGICWQGDEPAPCPEKFGENDLSKVRWCILPAGKAAGPLHARNIILNQLFNGERYILQIDAHSRFAKDWDARLISDLALCPTPKPILTAYPAGFRLDSSKSLAFIDVHTLAQPSPILCAERFDENGILRIVGRQSSVLSASPQPCLFWAAGFSFSPSQAYFSSGSRPEVPHLFFGEETLMALYFFVNGWRCFTPSGSNVIFHLWNSRSSRPETSSTVSGENRIRANKGFKRIMEEYRKSGQLTTFEEFIGVDYKTQEISERAKLGGRSSWSEFKIGAPLPKKALSLIDQYLH